MISTKVLMALLELLWTSAVTSFPITSLSIPENTFAELNSTSSTGNDRLATGVLLPALQDLFRDVKYQIEVEAADIVISAEYPDTQIDDDCHHKIEAQRPKATGTIEKSSFLRFGVTNVNWYGATVFADARLDSKLDINTDVCVRVGEKIFGDHCSQLGRKTVGIDVLSHGQTSVGLNLTTYNAHIAKVNGTWSLVFNFHATVVGTILKWNVEEVTAYNCKVKILDIEIGSVCGTIERHVKDKVQTLTDNVMTVLAPNLLTKLQNKINTNIGDVVVIPLTIGDEGPKAISI